MSDCCCSPLGPGGGGGGGAAPGQITGGLLVNVGSNSPNFELLDGGGVYTYQGSADFAAAGAGLAVVFNGTAREALATFILSCDRDTLATYPLEVSIDLNGDIIGNTSGFPWVQRAGILTTTKVGGLVVCQRLLTLAPGDTVSACFHVPGGTADGSIHVYNASMVLQ